MKITKIKLNAGIGLEGFTFLQEPRFEVTFDGSLFSVVEIGKSNKWFTTLHNVVWFQADESSEVVAVAPTGATKKSK